jgi:tight adherence protein B
MSVEWLLVHAPVPCALLLTLAYVVHARRSGGGDVSSRIARVRSRTAAIDDGRAPRAAATVRRREVRSVFGASFASLGSLVPRASVLRGKIDKAGLQLSVADLCLLSLLLAVVTAGLLASLYATPWWLAAGVGIVVAVMVPRMVIAKLIGRQAKLFLAGFPDAIDLMVRGVRSGLPVAEAINTAGQETTGVVAQTFRQIAGNIKLGLTLDEALWAAARRLELQEFKFFVISLSIQQETGGNLAEILSNLSHMMRRREQLRLKIKAMSSEARASALIIGALPFIMFFVIFFINPEYIMKFFIDPRGWVLLAVGIGSLLLGTLVMAKMVSFEI